jgi:hypothetical protein
MCDRAGIRELAFTAASYTVPLSEAHKSSGPAMLLGVVVADRADRGCFAEGELGAIGVIDRRQ